MATVHLGRLLGPVGFSRTIAVKRLHPQYAKDPDFVSMFLDEANLVSRIRHPNVVPTLDVVNSPSGGLLLVMEYVHGDSLSRLARKCREALVPIPMRIIAGIMSNVLLGLHAAHDARGNGGELLNIVHRDVSPQNILVGADGVARVLDFGVAKAAGRSQTTREGQVKGKLAYMAPEQIRGKVDRRTDVFAAGIMLWELLVGRRMFDGENEAQIISRIVNGQMDAPSKYMPSIPAEVNAIVVRALSPLPDARFATAKEMAIALEKAVGVATTSDIGDWVESLAKTELATRSAYIEHMERASAGLMPSRTDPPPAPFPGRPQSGHFNVGTPGQASYEVELAELSSPGTGSHSGALHGVPSQSNTRAWLLALLLLMVALAGVALLAFAIIHTKSMDEAPAPEPSSTAASSAVVPPATVTLPSASAPPGPSAIASSVAGALPSGVPSSAASSPGASSPGAPVPSESSGATDVQPTASAAPGASGWGAVPQLHPVWPLPSAKAKPACDPPFTLDAQGHRHYKPECPLE